MVETLFGVLTEQARVSPEERIARTRIFIQTTGANVDARDEYGFSLLHYAVRTHDSAAVEVARLLLDAHADPRAISETGVPVVLAAIEANDTAPQAVAASLELIDLLVARGAGLPAQTRLADFSCAALEVYRRLYALGARHDVPNARGQHAIHAAVVCQRPALVEWLLQQGVPLDVPDALGKTPLGLARAVSPTSPVRQRIIDAVVRAGAPERVPGTEPLACAQLVSLLGDDLPPRVARVLRGDVESGADLVAQLKRAASVSDASGVLEVLPTILGPPSTRVEEGSLVLKAPFFHHGDLVVKGSLRIVAPFLVTGDVKVEGCVSDAGPDSWVLIGGSLDALALDSDGDFLVAREIRARELVYGSYNDHTLTACGVSAPLVIMNDHSLDASVNAELFLNRDDYRQGYNDEAQARLRASLVAEVFVDEGRFHAPTALQRLERGLAIRRAGVAA